MCQAPGAEEGESQASGRVSGAPSWNAPAQQEIVLPGPGRRCAVSLVPVTAARAMAAADSPSAALRRHDLCSRGIRLAGKMRSDVVDLLDTYVSLPCSLWLPVGLGVLVEWLLLAGSGGLLAAVPGHEGSGPWQRWGMKRCRYPGLGAAGQCLGKLQVPGLALL